MYVYKGIYIKTSTSKTLLYIASPKSAKPRHRFAGGGGIEVKKGSLLGELCLEMKVADRRLTARKERADDHTHRCRSGNDVAPRP